MIEELMTQDQALEHCARMIEETSFIDLQGVMAKRKRAREDAQLRMNARIEMRKEMAAHLRAFINRPDLSPISVLERFATERSGPRAMLDLVDAWPLAWKGWLEITCTVSCTSNSIPPETRYSIALTDEGRDILALSKSPPLLTGAEN